MEKRQAVEAEDYEKAKLKKTQMEEYRLQMYKQLELEDLFELAGVSVVLRLTLLRVKPCTDVASNLRAIALQLDVRIACDGLQQKLQHAEYFTCDPPITQPIFKRFSLLFSKLHKLSNVSSYNMMR